MPIVRILTNAKADRVCPKFCEPTAKDGLKKQSRPQTPLSYASDPLNPGEVIIEPSNSDRNRSTTNV
jgi:hypothetical protein